MGRAEGSRAPGACGRRTVLLAFVEEVSVEAERFQGLKGSTAFSLSPSFVFCCPTGNPPQAAGSWGCRGGGRVMVSAEKRTLVPSSLHSHARRSAGLASRALGGELVRMLTSSRLWPFCVF